MKITAKDILKPALILFVICLVVTALLAGTNLLTKDKIAEQSALEAEQSRKIVLSDADSFEEADGYYIGKANNETVGYVFQTEAKGYGGAVKVMTGISADGQIHADNTDGLGLVADITHNAGVALAGADLLLVGAGGAAAGVLGPLLQAQPRSITVCNRTAAKAQALVARHQALAQQQNVQLLAQEQQALDRDFSIIINATAASLSGGAVPVPEGSVRPGALVYDMMYGPAAEGFLDWAWQQGGIARDGLGMLVEQAAAAFALWRGVQPPSAQVLDELRDLLLAQQA